MIDAISKWVPPVVLVAALFGVIAVLFRVLKIIVGIKHGEIMDNLKKVNKSFEEIAQSVNGMKDDMRASLLDFKYQLANMVTRDQYNESVLEIKSRVKHLEEDVQRILRLEQER